MKNWWKYIPGVSLVLTIKDGFKTYNEKPTLNKSPYSFVNDDRALPMALKLWSLHFALTGSITVVFTMLAVMGFEFPNGYFETMKEFLMNFYIDGEVGPMTSWRIHLAIIGVLTLTQWINNKGR